MQVKYEKTELSPVRHELRIEVGSEDVAAHFKKAVKEFTRSARIPGFRKGKVPTELVKKRFAREIENDLMERVVPDALGYALNESGLRPIHQPVIREVEVAADQPFKFTAAFEVRPMIKPHNYKGIEVDADGAEVGAAEVQEELDRLRERGAQYDPVDPRPLVDGDHALVDVSNRVVGEEGDENKQEGAMIEVGGADYHADFSNHLRGMSPGDERTFSIAYDEEDGDPRAAGKTVSYTVALKDVKQKVYPDLDDDFAQDVGDFENLDALKAHITSVLEARLKRDVRRHQENQLAQTLIGTLETEVPNTMVEQELDRALEEQARSLVARGIDPRTAPIDWRQARTKLREQAERNVKWELLLEAIAAEENIEASDEAVAERLERIAEDAKKPVEFVRSKLTQDGRMEELTRTLVLGKTVDFLLENAKITRR